MATIETRLKNLETQLATENQSLKVVFLKDGQTIEQARLDAGIPPDYDKQVLCVSFVSPQSAPSQPMVKADLALED
jgi:hypothetical protein